MVPFVARLMAQGSVAPLVVPRIVLFVFMVNRDFHFDRFGCCQPELDVLRFDIDQGLMAKEASPPVE